METKEILKNLRKTKGLSMQEFCEQSSISINTYQNYETGKRTPTVEILIKIAKFYNVSTDYLLGLEPLENPLAGMPTYVNVDNFCEKFRDFPDWMQRVFIDAMESLAAAAAKEHEKPELTVTERTGDVLAKREAEAEADNLKDA